MILSPFSLSTHTCTCIHTYTHIHRHVNLHIKIHARWVYHDGISSWYPTMEFLKSIWCRFNKQISKVISGMAWATGRAARGNFLIFPNCVSGSKLVLGCSWPVRNRRLGGFYSLHYKCYILEIHQITKLSFLGILRYKLKLTICFNLNLY